MVDIQDNAITSITLGIEDYESDDPRRMLSSIRNFYAGVVLLGKQCLANQAPDAEIDDVLGRNYKPTLDKEKALKYVQKGQQTVDLNDLKERFKDFGLEWPEGNIDMLNKIRNSIYSPPAPGGSDGGFGYDGLSSQDVPDGGERAQAV